MDKKWRETFLAWAETEQYHNAIEHAKRIIQAALQSYKCYLAFSGGKDSLAMLHLVCQFEPDIFVCHHSQGRYMPHQFEREIEQIAWLAGAKNMKIFPARLDFWTKIIPMLEEKGYTGVFVGLRKEESCSRKVRIAQKKYLTSMTEFWPLQNWSWMDVWAYIVENNLKYHSAYDIYAPVVGWENVRFHSFFDPRMEKFGNQNVDGVLLWQYRHKKRPS